MGSEDDEATGRGASGHPRRHAVGRSRHSRPSAHAWLGRFLSIVTLQPGSRQAPRPFSTRIRDASFLEISRWRTINPARVPTTAPCSNRMSPSERFTFAITELRRPITLADRSRLLELAALNAPDDRRTELAFQAAAALTEVGFSFDAEAILDLIPDDDVETRRGDVLLRSWAVIHRGEYHGREAHRRGGACAGRDRRRTRASSWNFVPPRRTSGVRPRISGSTTSSISSSAIGGATSRSAEPKRLVGQFLAWRRDERGIDLPPERTCWRLTRSASSSTNSRAARNSPTPFISRGSHARRSASLSPERGRRTDSGSGTGRLGSGSRAPTSACCGAGTTATRWTTSWSN